MPTLHPKVSEKQGPVVLDDEELEPLCPDSPDAQHHSAPIGCEEDFNLACTSCWYCGEKATELPGGAA